MEALAINNNSAAVNDSTVPFTDNARYADDSKVTTAENLIVTYYDHL